MDKLAVQILEARRERDEALALLKIQFKKTMTERTTPETDALQAQEWKPNWAAHARRLERERDEAQTALDEIEKYGTEEINAAVDLRRQLAVALIERDEAREQLAAERALADRLAGILDLYYADDTIAHQAGIADAIEAWKEARNDQTSRS